MTDETNEPVVVPDRITRYHPVVVRTRESMIKQWDGLMRSRGDDVVDIKVPRDQQRRAMRILHTLLTGAESRGWEVRAATRRRSPDRTPVIGVGDQECAIRISPVYRKVKRPEGDSRRAGYDLEATDRLRLTLVSVWTGRTKWQDGKRQRLENVLTQVLDGIQAHAERCEERDALRRAEELERRRRWEVAREAERQARLQALREDAVRRMLGDRRDALEARSLTGEIRRRNPNLDSDQEAWLDWIARWADQIDPAQAPPSAPPIPAELAGDPSDPSDRILHHGVTRSADDA